MNILLVDTASYNPGYSFWVNGKELFRRVLKGEKNADMIIPGIVEDFKLHNNDLMQVSHFSLANGPGSFTGLRVGSAISKGLCLSIGAHLVQVNSLDILANSYSDLKDKEGKIIIALIPSNSKTNEYYCGRYEVVNGESVLKSDYFVSIPDKLNIKEEEILLYHNDEDVCFNSQFSLTMKMIKEHKFTKIADSEPFYMKEFEPVKNKIIK